MRSQRTFLKSVWPTMATFLVAICLFFPVSLAVEGSNNEAEQELCEDFEEVVTVNTRRRIGTERRAAGSMSADRGPHQAKATTRPTIFCVGARNPDSLVPVRC